MNYKKSRWEKKRQHILKRDKFLCQHSLRFGKRIEATVVHHIYPVEYYPEFAWCDWNLISLSHEAHNKMHQRENHQMTELGMNLQKRVEIPPSKRGLFEALEER